MLYSNYDIGDVIAIIEITYKNIILKIIYHANTQVVE